MNIKSLNFETSNELINYISQSFQSDTKDLLTDSLTLIVPQLETKKNLVKKLSQEIKTVPDTIVLRMGEFLTSQMRILKPHIEFIDKSLLLLQLTSEFEDSYFQEKGGGELEKITEYVSVFAPIIGHSSYRKTFEEFISENDSFKDSYSQLYPLILKLWDFVTESPYMVSQWTLGWLFNNLEDLKKHKHRVIIYEPDTLKEIEKEFFNELSESWDIEYLKIIPKNSNPKGLKFKWIKNKSVFDELETLGQNSIQNSNLPITFIIPQRRKYYSELIELLFTSDQNKTSQVPNLSQSKCLSLIKKILRQSQKKYIKKDILESASFMKSKCSSRRDWDKLFLKRINLEIKKEINLDPKEKINFTSFIQKLEFLENENSLEKKDMDIFYKFLYSKSLVIPHEIKVSFEKWVSYISSVIENNVEKTLLKSLSKLDIKTLDDVDLTPDRQYHVLGCSQQAYEVSPFTYLSDYEIDKIHSDLGFNLEGLNLPSIYLNKFKKAKDIGVNMIFYSSEFNVFGEKESDPRFLKDLSLDQELQIEEGFLKRENIRETKDDPKEKIKDSLSLSACQLRPENKDLFCQQTYSASSLQKYINCPFKYFGEYVLGHKDIDILDYEPSPLIQGNIIHKLLEHFVGERSVQASEVQKEIKKTLEKNYKDWPKDLPMEIYFKNTGIELAKYINRDLDQGKIQNRKTLYKELNFKAYFDLDSMTFSKENKKGSVAFKGFIDRIDRIGDTIYIFDYKLSKGYSYSSWIREGLIQMPLYGLICLDKALPEGFPEGDLHQLSYILISDQYSTKLGLSVKDEISQSFEVRMDSRNSVKEPHLMAEALKGFRKLIRNTLLEIQKGNFSPAPLSKNTCNTCHWKTSCKAAHL